jgi:hypothetical protein
VINSVLIIKMLEGVKVDIIPGRIEELSMS